MQSYDPARLNRAFQLHAVVEARLSALRIKLEEEANFCGVPDVVPLGFTADGYLVKIERLDPPDCAAPTIEVTVLMNLAEITEFLANDA